MTESFCFSKMSMKIQRQRNFKSLVGNLTERKKVPRTNVQRVDEMCSRTVVAREALLSEI